MKKAIFLDRDGVINVERGEYTFKPENFILENGVKEALMLLKEAGFITIVVTNQGGIAKGLFTAVDVAACHGQMHRLLPGLIDDVFYSPYYPAFSESLGRKPGSLLFERAMALHQIDPGQSWMVGDNERDLVPARRLGIHTIGVGQPDKFASADVCVSSLLGGVKDVILRE